MISCTVPFKQPVLSAIEHTNTPVRKAQMAVMDLKFV